VGESTDTCVVDVAARQTLFFAYQPVLKYASALFDVNVDGQAFCCLGGSCFVLKTLVSDLILCEAAESRVHRYSAGP
jgi:hypothetical protein